MEGNLGYKKAMTLGKKEGKGGRREEGKKGRRGREARFLKYSLIILSDCKIIGIYVRPTLRTTVLFWVCTYWKNKSYKLIEQPR